MPKNLKSPKYIFYEDFCNDIVALRKSLWDKVLEYRRQNKIAYLKYRELLLDISPVISLFLVFVFISSIACFEMNANNDKDSNFETQSLDSLKYSIKEN